MRRVCTMSRLALAHTTPVSTAFWTTPENVCFCGILKDKCQLVGTLLLCGMVTLLVCTKREDKYGNKYFKSFLRLAYHKW